MTLLFIDTETTGFPKRAGWDEYHDPTDIHAYKDARIVSICWIIGSEDGSAKKSMNFMVKPDDFTIDNNGDACKINGITQEMALENGCEIREILRALREDISSYNPQKIIAHNLDFDIHVLLSEIYRCNLTNGFVLSLKELYETISEMERYCTMKMGKDITRIIMPSGRIKSPKLIELYQKLFGNQTFTQHNAFDDTFACFRCYFMIENTEDVVEKINEYMTILNTSGVSVPQ